MASLAFLVALFSILRTLCWFEGRAAGGPACGVPAAGTTSDLPVRRVAFWLRRSGQFPADMLECRHGQPLSESTGAA